MKLKYRSTNRYGGSLGDESLFENYFVCVQQKSAQDKKILYGKAPAGHELGTIHETYEFLDTSKAVLSFYSIAAGADRITLNDVRIIEGNPSVCLIVDHSCDLLSGNLKNAIKVAGHRLFFNRE